MWHLYALVDPSDESVFYIGLSKYPEERRHIHESNHASAAMHMVRTLRDMGFPPFLKILATYTDYKKAAAAEIRAIKQREGLVNRYPKGRWIREVVHIETAKKRATDRKSPVASSGTM